MTPEPPTYPEILPISQTTSCPAPEAQRNFAGYLVSGEPNRSFLIAVPQS